MSTKPKKGAVRTRLSREQRQKDIVDAARRVFLERGYEQSTIADIAESVGVVEGTVLHYFKSKRALMVTVTEEFYAEITTRMEKGVSGINGVRNKLRYIIHSHLSFLQDNSALCTVILNESRGTNPELLEKVHQLNKRYTSIVINTVKDGKKSGEIAEHVPATLVRNVVFGCTEHYLWDNISGGKQSDIEKVSDNLTQLIYIGIQNHSENFDSEVNRLISKLNNLIS